MFCTAAYTSSELRRFEQVRGEKTNEWRGMALYGGATHGEHQAVADCVGDAREDEHQHAQDAARALRRHAQEGAGAGQHSRVAGFWILAEDLKKKKQKKEISRTNNVAVKELQKKQTKKVFPPFFFFPLFVCARVCVLPSVKGS